MVIEAAVTSSAYCRRPNRRLLPIAAVSLAAILTTPARAEPDPDPGHDSSAFVQAGEGDRAVRTVAIGATSNFVAVDPDHPTPWSFYGEVILGEWFVHHHEAGDRTAFTQITAAPVVRYTFGGFLRGVFVELGIGPTLITPQFHDYGRRFSTVFQFDDHASLGMRFGARDANEISVRAEHFSNGGIRNPNPGQDFAQLRYARHF